MSQLEKTKLIGSRRTEQSLTDYKIKDPNWKPEMKMKDGIEYTCFTDRLGNPIVQTDAKIKAILGDNN